MSASGQVDPACCYSTAPTPSTPSAATVGAQGRESDPYGPSRAPRAARLRARPHRCAPTTTKLADASTTELTELVTRAVGYIERATGRSLRRPAPPAAGVRRAPAPRHRCPACSTPSSTSASATPPCPGLLRATGDPVFVWDSLPPARAGLRRGRGGLLSRHPSPPSIDEALRRHGVPDVSELDVAGTTRPRRPTSPTSIDRTVGRPFPQDPDAAAPRAVEAVLRSWNAERAVAYRRLAGSARDLRTPPSRSRRWCSATWGRRQDPASGFTRDPTTGREPPLSRLPARRARRRRRRRPPTSRRPRTARRRHPRARRRAPGDASDDTLEAIFADAQDFEFTVENGKLWLLQTRSGQTHALGRVADRL